MAESHSFRSAFNGFNRQDVVHYIEYLNHKHTGLINQMKSENQALRDELSALRAAGASATTESDKDALIAQLQAQLEELQAQSSGNAEQLANAELEAYRRAERAERAAKERAEQIYFQATATLSQAATQVDEAAKLFSTIADQISTQIGQLQSAADSGKAALQDAASTMYAIHTETPEE